MNLSWPFLQRKKQILDALQFGIDHFDMDELSRVHRGHRLRLGPQRPAEQCTHFAILRFLASGANGYDGVQIHAAHFFYLSKFISPLLNHRSDRYGGNQRGRTQILLEILQDMRAKTSQDFLITMKINSTDEYPGGLTHHGFLETSRLMAEAGIDAIEVSVNGTSRGGIRAGLNEAYFLDAAKLLAERVKVPVVLVGGLRSMEKINEILNETNIAYISLSRPLIREPNLINRWQQGDTTPSKCVSCNSCYRTLGHRCVFN